MGVWYTTSCEAAWYAEQAVCLKCGGGAAAIVYRDEGDRLELTCECGNEHESRRPLRKRRKRALALRRRRSYTHGRE